MHQNTRQEQFLLNWTRMVPDTPFHLSQKPFLQPNETMKFTIGNSLQSFELWKNGDITSKARHTRQLCYQITKTSRIIEKEAKKLNRRQARWSLYLSEFDVKLVHTPGSKMIQSDALSRRPDLCPEIGRAHV